MCRAWREYLLWFANEHKDFWFDEIEAVSKLLGVRMKWGKRPTDVMESEKAAKELASRSVTLRYIVDLWSHSSCCTTFHNGMRSLPPSFIQPYTAPTVSFKVKVEVFGKSQSQQEKIARIETFSYLPFEGPVKLKNPDVSFQYIEFFGMDSNCIPEEPLHYYFGRIVAEGRRDLIAKHSLKKRKFIGNTSMDPQLALIMANLAQVKNGSLILDPFVGSGSLLIAAAEFQGYVLGVDMNYVMLHGQSKPTRKQNRFKPRKDESILSNMKEYALSQYYLDVVVADSSLPLWTASLCLDAVITDPPYGVREAVERLGTTKEDKTVDEKHVKNHIPCKVQYSMSQLNADLMNFSARHLRIGGRLVTWVPVIRCEYTEESLPKHNALELISNCEQILSTTSSRRLLTFIKIQEPKEDIKVEVDENETFRQKYYKYVEELRKSKKSEKKCRTQC